MQALTSFVRSSSSPIPRLRLIYSLGGFHQQSIDLNVRNRIRYYSDFEQPRPIPLGDAEAQREFEDLQRQFAMITEIIASKGLSENGFERGPINPDIDKNGVNKVTGELNGPKGPEPTRFGDWEVKGWVYAENTEDLLGPIIIISLADLPSLLATMETGTVVSKSTRELELTPDLSKLEPNKSNQVFIGQSLIPGQFSLKTSSGKYLGSDSVGKIMATRAAVSPLEEWRPIKLDQAPDDPNPVNPHARLCLGQFAFQNIHGRYLSVDPNTGRLRADAEELGSQERFTVKCQAANKRNARSDEPGEMISTIIDYTTLERNAAKRFISWGGGRLKMKETSERELSEAEKAGRLHEALLEKRMKSKHDPFC